MEKKIKELWKSISEYDGLYEISNLGRVKSLKRSIMGRNGKKLSVKGRMLKLNNGDGGYIYVTLSNIKKEQCRVHILVWDVFGDKPRNGRKIQVDHKDGDKTRNCISNLQLLSPRGNVSKGYQQNGTKYPTGVSWSKSNKKYQAYIWLNGKNKYLGQFDTVEKAEIIYKKALKQIEE